MQNAIKNYRRAMHNNLLIYKGAEYTAYYPNTTGHPFFLSDSLQSGIASYEGILYFDLQLKYDIVSEEVLLKGPQNLLLKLAAEKVDSFSIGDHLFVKLQGDSNRQNPPPHFYERLYTGSSTVWLRQTKLPKRTFNPEDPDQFAQYNTYYIEKEGRYTAIANETDLAAVFGEQRAAVKKYLRKEGYRFKKDPGQTVLKAAAYYDGLKK